MAGPGIRYWELATALAPRHDVTLVAPGHVDLQAHGFRVLPRGRRLDAGTIGRCDAVVCQQVSPMVLDLARRGGARLIYDAYDPVLLENLELQRSAAPRRRRAILDGLRADLGYALRHADAVACSSEKQRDLWLGAAMAVGAITPERYDRDPSLRGFIDVVPFGVQNADPAAGSPGPRRLFGLGDDDPVLLWGGGIWDWFDPLTPIRAVARLAGRRPPVRLVFMGTRHPNPAFGEMPMVRTARALAVELGVLDSRVFFNDGWVPYDQRPAWFLDADLGVSAHFDHLETRFSFRTRMLDYIWAGLPIVATEGDPFADLIVDRDLGAVVGYQDAAAFAAAVAGLLDDPGRRRTITSNLRVARAAMSWDASAAVLERLLGGVDERTPAGGTDSAMYWVRRVRTVLARDGVGATARRILRRGT